MGVPRTPAGSTSGQQKVAGLAHDGRPTWYQLQAQSLGSGQHGDGTSADCAICLDTVVPDEVPDPLLHPACLRHRLHLTCLAQQRVQANSRHGISRRPTMSGGGVSRQGDCAAPTRLPAPSTVRHAVEDYATRTFNDAAASVDRIATLGAID